MGIECASTCGADSKHNVPYINIPIPANIIIIIEGKKFVNWINHIIVSQNNKDTEISLHYCPNTRVT